MINDQPDSFLNIIKKKLKSNKIEDNNYVSKYNLEPDMNCAIFVIGGKAII